MSAADSPEQSAKRVVSKCGLMGLSAAVFQCRQQTDMVKWLRGQKKIYIDLRKMPEGWREWLQKGDDFWSVIQYALLTKNKKERKPF